MAKTILPILAIILLAGTAPASTGSMNGNYLLQQCTSNTEQGRTACIGYVLGYVDATVVWKVNVGGIPVCIPEEPRLTIQQIADVIVKWLKTHPREKDQAAGHLVKIILEETWPCRES